MSAHFLMFRNEKNTKHHQDHGRGKHNPLRTIKRMDLLKKHNPRNVAHADPKGLKDWKARHRVAIHRRHIQCVGLCQECRNHAHD